jgi:hypothetical protein
MHERWPTGDRTWRILFRTGPIKNGSKVRFANALGNGRCLRTTIIVRQMAVFPTICRAHATCSALDFASLPGPIQRESSRPTRMFRQADGKPELMIDRAHGGASPEQPRRHWWRQFLGWIGTCVDARLGSPGSHSTATSGHPPPRSKPTRLPAFFAVVLATRLFAPTLKCGL